MAYFKILINQEKKQNSENNDNGLLKLMSGGDNCHRNDNGTVNTDGCSGWEMVSYVFSAAINCGSGEATNWYYNCCQAAVCRNC